MSLLRTVKVAATTTDQLPSPSCALRTATVRTRDCATVLPEVGRSTVGASACTDCAVRLSASVASLRSHRSQNRVAIPAGSGLRNAVGEVVVGCAVATMVRGIAHATASATGPAATAAHTPIRPGRPAGGRPSGCREKGSECGAAEGWQRARGLAFGVSGWACRGSWGRGETADAPMEPRTIHRFAHHQNPWRSRFGHSARGEFSAPVVSWRCHSPCLVTGVLPPPRQHAGRREGRAGIQEIPNSPRPCRQSPRHRTTTHHGRHGNSPRSGRPPEKLTTASDELTTPAHRLAGSDRSHSPTRKGQPSGPLRLPFPSGARAWPCLAHRRARVPRRAIAQPDCAAVTRGLRRIRDASQRPHCPVRNRGASTAQAVAQAGRAAVGGGAAVVAQPFLNLCATASPRLLGNRRNAVLEVTECARRKVSRLGGCLGVPRRTAGRRRPSPGASVKHTLV